MAKNTNYFQLALDLCRGPWLISNPEVHLSTVRAFLSRMPIQASHLEEFQLSLREDAGSPADKKQRRKVFIAPIHTVMTKYDTCETYGTATIAAEIEKYIYKEDVVGFILDIDSGGGAANAVAPLIEVIEKIRQQGKPVVAHCDSCYSAAYWVASQCDAIFADNTLTSGVGSIGAYVSILDDRVDKQTGYKIIDVYAPESTDKNKAYREALDGKTEAMEKELSDLVKTFHRSVRAGRPNLKAEEPGVLSGATFRAMKAMDLGMIDGVKHLDEVVENVLIRADYA